MVQGDSVVSANLYCNSRISVLGRLHDYMRKYMNRSVLRSDRNPEAHVAQYKRNQFKVTMDNDIVYKL